MKWKKILLFSITGTLFLCVICNAGAAFLTAQRDRQSYHVYCELLTPGIAFSEVEERLSSIGPYSISGGPDIYYVSFQDTLTYISVGKMLLAFDDDKRLVSTARNVSLSDWMEGADCQNNR
jgi:hypothetical protein